jgi:hypothetical protein
MAMRQASRRTSSLHQRSGAGVFERALQAAFKVQHELLELAHDAGQRRGVGVAWFRVAGSGVALQQGH